MRPTSGILAASALLLLAACGDEPDIVIGGDAVRTLSVEGSGEASGTPDLAILQFGVTTTSASAGGAAASNADTMTKVRDALREAGIERRHMQTSNYSLNPMREYSQRNGRQSERIVGYEATNMLTVRLEDVSAIGETIDRATGSGANQLSNLQFGFQDDESLRETARRSAVEDARRKAETIADAADVDLGEIQSITVREYNHGPQPMMSMRAEMTDAASTPIEAGESTIVMSASVVFTLD